MFKLTTLSEKAAATDAGKALALFAGDVPDGPRKEVVARLAALSLLKVKDREGLKYVHACLTEKTVAPATKWPKQLYAESLIGPVGASEDEVAAIKEQVAGAVYDVINSKTLLVEDIPAAPKIDVKQLVKQDKADNAAEKSESIDTPTIPLTLDALLSNKFSHFRFMMTRTLEAFWPAAFEHYGVIKHSGAEDAKRKAYAFALDAYRAWLGKPGT